jgi:RNA polymerase sigma-70 factor (ECF subfamily)
MPQPSANKRVNIQSMFPDEIAIGYKPEGFGADKPDQSVCAGAGIAFEELFERYQKMVYQLSYRMLGDREEAMDLSQEVFLTVYRKMNHFRGESSLKTWIYRIAVNRASNRCRWWNRLRRRGTVSLDEHLSGERSSPLAEMIESQGKTPEEILLLQEERAELLHLLLELPLQQRIAVIMRDMEGMSYEEIADATGISLGTVKSRIARGRDELKRRLNGSLG